MLKIFSSYLACLSAAFFSFYNVFQLSFFNSISKDLLFTFSIHQFGLGLFASSFLFANALWLIPGGILFDRFSLRKLGLLFFGIAIIAAYILSISHKLGFCIIARILQGMASAMSLLLSIRIASICFPSYAGVAIGFMFAMASLGGIIANVLMPHILIIEYWQHALLQSGNVGLVFLLFMFIFLHVPNNLSDKKPFDLVNGLQALTIKTLRLGIYIGLTTLPLFILGALWGNMLLSQFYHLSFQIAGKITAFLYVGILFGSPLIGFINDNIKKAGLLMAVCPMAGIIILLLIIFGNIPSILMLKILFFLLGILSSSNTIAFTMLAVEFSLKLRSTVIGIAALLENIIGAISLALFGALLDFSKILFKSFTVDLSYKLSLTIMPIAFSICILIGFMQHRSQILQFKERLSCL